LEDRAVQIDTDTFMVTAYTIIDDLYQERIAPHKPLRPGPKPVVCDSEVMTQMVLAQYCPQRSERWMLRYAKKHWKRYFPRMLKQSAFNVRARDLAGALCQLGPLIAEQMRRELGLDWSFEVIDGVGVPLMRRCRGDRHRLFGNEAAVGRAGADKDYIYGVKADVAVSAAGLVSGFVLGPANTEEHFLAEALFCRRLDPQAPIPTAQQLEAVLGPSHRHGGKRFGPSGPVNTLGAGKPNPAPYVSDLGLHGKAWQAHWREHYGATVLTKEAYDDLPAAERRKMSRWLCGIRQRVETSFCWLESRFGLLFPRARSYWGLLARLGAKFAAFNIAMVFNYLNDLPTYALFDPICDGVD
jgi:hypothetical protein